MLRIIAPRPLVRALNKMNSSANYSTQVQEQQVNIDGQRINYIKTGTGAHSLLCFPGALGTIWSDFAPQIESLNKDKFTVVAWDPPGYGRSRPPDRQFTKDFYHKDAEIAYQLMKVLGISKFSLLGWSDGGISSMILAAKYPDNVSKLVVWGANSYVIADEIKAYEKIRNITNWSDRMKAPLIKLYGEKGLQDMWSGWCDVLIKLFKDGGNLCKNCLSQINCPTLIVHGDKDPMVAIEHPTYLLQNIKGSKLHSFTDGKHNLHLKYAEEFNKLVTEFLEK